MENTYTLKQHETASSCSTEWLLGVEKVSLPAALAPMCCSWGSVKGVERREKADSQCQSKSYKHFCSSCLEYLCDQRRNTSSSSSSTPTQQSRPGTSVHRHQPTIMSQLYQHRHGSLLQPVQAPARCVVAAAGKKQQKPKRRKPKQPVSQRISYIEGAQSNA